MNSQRQLNGHPATSSVWQIAGTATQQVRHIRTGIDIVAIVVLTFFAAVYLVWHSCPLGIITRTFQTTGHSAQLAASLDIAHSASEPHCISSHNARLVAEVG